MRDPACVGVTAEATGAGMEEPCDWGGFIPFRAKMAYRDAALHCWGDAVVIWKQYPGEKKLLSPSQCETLVWQWDD